MHQLRLIWIADILSFSDRFVHEIDWTRVARRYPFVMNALPLIHCLVPLPELVRQRSGVTLVSPPGGLGEAYQGWPETKALVWDGVSGRLQFLKRSLFPPEWWLRFCYEAGTGRVRLWKARSQHWSMLGRTAVRSAGELIPRLHRPPKYESPATRDLSTVFDGPTPLLLRRRSRVAKRVADLLLGCVGLICALPVILLAAGSVKLVSAGPALFRQERSGLHGKPITVWKLRTMFPDADERLEQYLDAQPELRGEWNSRFSLTKDPRILPYVGNFLRRFSLDELPQLWNVVTGDMSIVGPRPLPDYHLKTLPETFRELRQQAQPGMTGLWQVTARNDADLPEHQLQDEYYVMYWSPWMDFKILVTTMITVVTGRGAD